MVSRYESTCLGSFSAQQDAHGVAIGELADRRAKTSRTRPRGISAHRAQLMVSLVLVLAASLAVAWFGSRSRR